MDVKATLFSLIYFVYTYIQVSAEYWKSIGKFVLSTSWCRCKSNEIFAKNKILFHAVAAIHMGDDA